MTGMYWNRGRTPATECDPCVLDPERCIQETPETPSQRYIMEYEYTEQSKCEKKERSSERMGGPFTEFRGHPPHSEIRPSEDKAKALHYVISHTFS
ncbi:hypothetical protein NPIL_317871 [Nephila pilipes]|uniref:Uncharacterized protein n=1 Tax=Nephila pilipes TaxID=299642 RepID=A0A8X6QMH3_NEPPI|nr:hypothetical protein NPIL_317871 [Nephila pilipes]